jgi:hypothetical protein
MNGSRKSVRARKAAELRFRILVEHRQQDLALVGRDDRPVIGDELCRQRGDKQEQENPERPVAAPVGLEQLQPALVDAGQPRRFLRLQFDLVDVGGGGIHGGYTCRLSKSMRGSIQV